MNFTENITTLFDKVNQLVKSEMVVGKPIISGKMTLIPLFTITFGAGSGGSGKNTDISNDGFGGGAGAGGKITTNAIVVIKEDDVRIFSLENSGSVNKILEMIPDIVTKIKTEQL